MFRKATLIVQDKG